MVSIAADHRRAEPVPDPQSGGLPEPHAKPDGSDPESDRSGTDFPDRESDGHAIPDGESDALGEPYRVSVEHALVLPGRVADPLCARPRGHRGPAGPET